MTISGDGGERDRDAGLGLPRRERRAPRAAHHVRARRRQPRQRVGDEVLLGEKSRARYQISKQEQVLEILRNPTTNPPDKVKAVLVQGLGRQLRQALRRHRKAGQLGQHRLDESNGRCRRRWNRLSLRLGRAGLGLTAQGLETLPRKKSCISARHVLFADAGDDLEPMVVARQLAAAHGRDDRAGSDSRPHRRRASRPARAPARRRTSGTARWSRTPSRRSAGSCRPARAASRIATISACAVGSPDEIGWLNPRPTIAPRRPATTDGANSRTSPVIAASVNAAAPRIAIASMHRAPIALRPSCHDRSVATTLCRHSR